MVLNTCINLFIPSVEGYYPYFTERNGGGMEKLGKLANLTQLVNDKGGIQTQAG